MGKNYMIEIISEEQVVLLDKFLKDNNINNVSVTDNAYEETLKDIILTRYQNMVWDRETDKATYEALEKVDFDKLAHLMNYRDDYDIFSEVEGRVTDVLESFVKGNPEEEYLEALKK